MPTSGGPFIMRIFLRISALELPYHPVEKAALHGVRGKMVRKYFGTDGIRGRANGTITAELALRVGQAAGLTFRRGDHRHRVLIGKDTRLSGYMIETALVAGFTSVGMDVLLTGPIPTPAVGMLTRSMRADLGVMISASHNPFDDNGIKLFGPDGFKLSDEVEHQIETLIDSELDKRLARGADLGRARRIDGVQDRYIEFAKRTLPRNLSLAGLRVVVDCAHGAGYRVTPEALRELDAEVIAMGIEPNGLNINRECGSTEPAALCLKVKEMRADVGIALDGDADRVLMADERGRIVDGDQLLAVIAESWNADGRLAKPGIVATVMSNLGLERYLGTLGVVLVRTPVGDRYVLEHMRNHGYNVGGEPSGHIILSDYTTTGDGLLAALQVLAVVKRQGEPVSKVCHRFDPLPQILKNVRYRSGKPLEDSKVRSAIQDAEARLDGHGRLIVRSSGTEPVIRVMGEGDDRMLVEEIVDGIVDALNDAA
jgi:phosphoglucosamine mutase